MAGLWASHQILLLVLLLLLVVHAVSKCAMPVISTSHCCPRQWPSMNVMTGKGSTC